MTSSGVTASRVMRLAEDLEDRSRVFYGELADLFADQRETFLGLAEQSTKNKMSLVRTYRETVSDALEVGFSFEGMDLERYEVDTTLDESVTFAEAVEQAIQLEERVLAFHETVAQHSRSLLATIPMAFKAAAKKRKQNLHQLQSLLE